MTLVAPITLLYASSRVKLLIKNTPEELTVFRVVRLVIVPTAAP